MKNMQSKLKDIGKLMKVGLVDYAWKEGMNKWDEYIET